MCVNPSVCTKGSYSRKVEVVTSPTFNSSSPYILTRWGASDGGARVETNERTILIAARATRAKDVDAT